MIPGMFERGCVGLQTTPTVKYNAALNELKVGEAGGKMTLKGGTTCEGTTPPPPPAHSDCVFNASGSDLCTYNATAPTFLPSLEYRLITGLGIFPPLIVMASAVLTMHDSEEFRASQAASVSNVRSTSNPLKQ